MKIDPKARCPHCDKVGLRFDYAAQKIRCPHCYMSGIKLDDPDPPKTILDEEPKPKPKVITGKEDDKALIIDKYQDVRPNGVTVDRIVTHSLAKSEEKYIPDLLINLSQVRFQQHRLKNVIALEKRWGRDDMRTRGFHKMRELVPETGEVNKVFRRIDGEAVEKGSYVRSQVETILRNFRPIEDEEIPDILVTPADILNEGPDCEDDEGDRLASI